MADEETKEPQADETPGGSPALLKTCPPWEDRKSLGLCPAIVETVKDVALHPATAFEKMKLEGGVKPPLTFAIIMMVSTGVGASITSLIRSGSLTNMLAIATFFAVLAFISPFISAGLVHLVLKLIDAVEEPFEVTYGTVCYSQAPLVFGIVPYVGLFLYTWHLVCLVIGLTKTQKCSIGQAIAAVLAPAIFFMCLVVGLMIALLVLVGVAVTSSGA